MKHTAVLALESEAQGRKPAGSSPEGEDELPPLRGLRALPSWPALSLGTVIGRTDEGGWRVTVGAHEAVASLDAAVDPALIAACAEKRSRVLLSAEPGAPGAAGSPLVIVGALMTERALTIDRAGHLRADVERISLTARADVLIRNSHTFLRLKGEDVELYGRQIVSRAREVCRILGRLVKIN